MAYVAHGSQVLFQHNSGEVDARAECSEAQQAAELLNRASYLNDVKRQYTAAARLIYKAQQLPGFVWIDGDGAVA